jgi:hypothetical protein
LPGRYHHQEHREHPGRMNLAGFDIKRADRTRDGGRSDVRRLHSGLLKLYLGVRP